MKRNIYILLGVVLLVGIALAQNRIAVLPLF